MEKTKAITVTFPIPEAVWEQFPPEHEKLCQLLLRYTAKKYGQPLWDEAWRHFTKGKNPLPTDQTETTSFFIPWFLFDWTSKDASLDISQKTIADVFQEKNPRMLTPADVLILKGAASGSWSFFAVKMVHHDSSLTVEDIMLKEEHQTHAPTGLRTPSEGEIFYGRLIPDEKKRRFLGLASNPFPQEKRQDFNLFRESLALFRETINTAFLKKQADTLRETFFHGLSILKNPPASPEEAAQGAIFCELSFSLSCSAQEAYDLLSPLSGKLAEEQNPFAALKKDSSGNLESAHFLWFDESTSALPIGMIKIEGNALSIEVDTQEKEAMVRETMQKLLGHRATFQGTKEESLQDRLKEMMDELMKADLSRFVPNNLPPTGEPPA